MKAELKSTVYCCIEAIFRRVTYSIPVLFDLLCFSCESEMADGTVLTRFHILEGQAKEVGARLLELITLSASDWIQY